MRRFGSLCGVGFLIAAGTLISWWNSNRPLSRDAADRLLAIAVQNSDIGQNEVAAQQFQRIVTAYPDHYRARVLQASLLMNMRRSSEAREAIAALPDDYLMSRCDESFLLAKFMTSNGYLAEAESLLRRLLEVQPHNIPARKELLKCLRIAGENSAAAPFLRAALSDPQVELSDLLMATAPRLFWASAEDVRFMKNVGQRNNDSLTLLGYARREIGDGNFASAFRILDGILRARPDWQPAQVRKAYASWMTGDDAAWAKCMQSWAPERLHDPDAWFIWGVWHDHLRQPEVAARCFSEALAREPKHLGVSSQLTKVLHELGYDAEAQQLKPYSERLALIDQYCQDVTYQPRPEMVEQLANECAALGWRNESSAWIRYGKRHWKDYDWPDVAAAENQAPVDGEGAPHPLQRLVPTLDFHTLPLPKPQMVTPTPQQKYNETLAKAPNWSLDDEAAAMGIDFRFQNGLDPQRDRAYMFEFAGPGVGVLDYDSDGWPDLHLTQGAVWPLTPDDTTLRDELLRNLGDGKFQAVADLARITESGYSQGPAVGDFDADGFPDLYVCNIGPNRLYHNNGDGTFTEITAESDFAGDDWSISAAWADVNDDGLSDLYVVNYLTGDVFERACRAADGRPVQCPPMQFPAANDRLYLNRGDGVFQDISSSAGVLVPDGKGMGIVVGRLGDDAQQGIFVANDTTANYLFTRQADSVAAPQFREIGAIAGVAFGPLGNAQSSMGVAAGDVNGDGRLDLFVTNWMAETCNLFLQGAGGIYEDQAIRFGAAADEMLMEGWGTQFFDVDADGFVDLFVANGHLEENDSKGGRMPPHLFRNRDGRKLELVASPKVGSYFEKQYLGRSVAVWDWNRDGRQDLVVSHTTDPVAVLTNRTHDTGHAIGLRLIGTQCERDPIGVLVTLSVGDRLLVRELVSGDGYAATNERKLYLGLGSHSDNVNLDISWPDGTSQRFADLASDIEYVLIQGRTDAIPVRRFNHDPATAAQ